MIHTGQNAARKRFNTLRGVSGVETDTRMRPYLESFAPAPASATSAPLEVTPDQTGALAPKPTLASASGVQPTTPAQTARSDALSQMQRSSGGTGNSTLMSASQLGTMFDNNGSSNNLTGFLQRSQENAVTSLRNEANNSPLKRFGFSTGGPMPNKPLPEGSVLENGGPIIDPKGSPNKDTVNLTSASGVRIKGADSEFMFPAKSAKALKEMLGGEEDALEKFVMATNDGKPPVGVRKNGRVHAVDGADVAAWLEEQRALDEAERRAAQPRPAGTSVVPRAQTLPAVIEGKGVRAQPRPAGTSVVPRAQTLPAVIEGVRLPPRTSVVPRAQTLPAVIEGVQPRPAGTPVAPAGRLDTGYRPSITMGGAQSEVNKRAAAFAAKAGEAVGHGVRYMGSALGPAAVSRLGQAAALTGSLASAPATLAAGATEGAVRLANLPSPDHPLRGKHTAEATDMYAGQDNDQAANEALAARERLYPGGFQLGPREATAATPDQVKTAPGEYRGESWAQNMRKPIANRREEFKNSDSLKEYQNFIANRDAEIVARGNEYARTTGDARFSADSRKMAEEMGLTGVRLAPSEYGKAGGIVVGNDPKTGLRTLVGDGENNKFVKERDAADQARREKEAVDAFNTQEKVMRQLYPNHSPSTARLAVRDAQANQLAIAEAKDSGHVAGTGEDKLAQAKQKIVQDYMKESFKRTEKDKDGKQYSFEDTDGRRAFENHVLAEAKRNKKSPDTYGIEDIQLLRKDWETTNRFKDRLNTAAKADGDIKLPKLEEVPDLRNVRFMKGGVRTNDILGGQGNMTTVGDWGNNLLFDKGMIEYTYVDGANKEKVVRIPSSKILYDADGRKDEELYNLIKAAEAKRNK